MSSQYRSGLVLLSLVPCILADSRNARAETIRFLVGEVPSRATRHDSYVLPLQDPAAIEHARELIRLGPDRSGAKAIVGAEIVRGRNGINRNYLAPGAPEWSWHISNFIGFADGSIEILDGTPTGVEQNLEAWMRNTGGRIGFWEYTVIAELPAGDYHADWIVDEKDYQAWRSAYGATMDLSADGNGDAIVNAADYVVWRNNLGHSTPLPLQLSAPTIEAAIIISEPTTSVFGVLGLTVLFGKRLSRP